MRHARIYSVHAPAKDIQLIDKDHHGARHGCRVGQCVIATRQEADLIRSHRLAEQTPKPRGAHTNVDLVQLSCVELVVLAANLVAKDARKLGFPFLNQVIIY